MRGAPYSMILAACLAAGGLALAPAKGAERQFLVLLAHSPKQFPDTGLPPGGLPNPESVRRQYFDLIDPAVGSFAEYWEEISFGDVLISGETTDWINLPWAIQPPAIGDDVNSPARFYDLNEDALYTYGQGERPSNLQAIIIDRDGDVPGGADNGPFAPFPASGHVTDQGHPVWKPGERFIDMDGDGKWDGLDEANNMMDHDGDKVVDLPGPWIDLNGDGEAHPGSGSWCAFLPDSDNDGNPDCCPNGPGDTGHLVEPGYEGCGRYNIEVPHADYEANPELVCPPLIWTGPGNIQVTDCNCNMIPDVCDIDPLDNPDAPAQCAALGWTGPFPFVRSRDQNPSDGPNQPNPDGIPDECQFQRGPNGVNGAVSFCIEWAPGFECTPLDVPRMDIAELRCEFFDMGQDGLSIVEPFENFMRRWDPCIHDPDATPTSEPTDRTHWIKVYDPASTSTATCDNPPSTVVYNDPSYISDNYPARQADVQDLIDDAHGRVIFGTHDPHQLITAATDCVCDDGCLCGPPGADCMAATYGLEPDGFPTNIPRFCVVGTHVEYDPPDGWINSLAPDAPSPDEAYSTKMQRASSVEPGQAGSIRFEHTPEPAWYQQAWGDRYRKDNPDFDPNTPVGVNNPTTLPCEAPLWPGGDENIPHVVPFADANEPTYDPDVNRRYFKANAGGTSVDFATGRRVGVGTGWLGCSYALDPVLVFETGYPGPNGFERLCNARILPEEIEMAYGANQGAPIFYDGWVEHDDLPSSKYHQAGDQRLGEVTSPYNEAMWGHDRGTHQLHAAPLGPDGILPAAGPYALNIHGNFGFDGGNLLSMEYLSWRTAPPFTDGAAWEQHAGPGASQQSRDHPYAGPSGANLGFRDFNLDGLVDLGESRFTGSENYVADSSAATPNDGRGSAYPFNSRRLMEDCVEVLDVLLDLGGWVDEESLQARSCVDGPQAAAIPASYEGRGDPAVLAPAGLNSGIILLPPGSHEPREFLTATGFYPIHTADTASPATSFPADAGADGETLNWSIFFHDLVRAIDVEFVDNVIPTDNFQTAFAAHHYLHLWQGFPDLYDYDVFIEQPGAVINTPVGRWDIMARGGLVHPSPPLRESACTRWIRPRDLTHILPPGVDRTITIPPYELVRNHSVYYLDNNDSPGESFYLWSVGRGFDEALPGGGMLIMHTNLLDGAADESSRSFPYRYLIEQADGLHELEAGIEPYGDAGDPWPGTTGKTAFNCDTNPAARWHNNTCAGLNIFDIVPGGYGDTAVSLNWLPTDIPSMRFRPPSGQSVGAPPETLYQVRTVANDLYGGTWLRLFQTTDPTDTSIDPHGANYVGTVRKLAPGQTEPAVDWNIAGLPDGRYWLFAEVIPDEGPDGADAPATPPHAGHANAGNGTVLVDGVDTSRATAFGLSAFLTDPTHAVAFDESNNPIDFAAAGVTVDSQFMLEGFTIRGPALRTIAAISPSGHVLTLSAPIQGALPPGGGTWLIVEPGTAPLDTWIATRIDYFADAWEVQSLLEYPNGAGIATTGSPYGSPGGELDFTIHAGDMPFAMGDQFTLTTTGLTAPSHPLRIIDGRILEVVGDFNHDAITDLADHAAFWRCLEASGPQQGLPPGECRSAFDLDDDTDVDLEDYRGFVAAFDAGP